MMGLTKIKVSCFLVMLFVLWSIPVFSSEDVAVVEKDAVVVWAQEDGSRHAVFLGKRVDGEWEPMVTISDNEMLNLVPSVAVKDDQVWVVWTVFDKGSSELYLKRSINGEWEDAEKIETGLPANIASTLIFDSEGTLWLAWAGSDGQDDEIFYSTWNGSIFEPPERITDNGVPDVLPVLGLTPEGKLWIQWKYHSDDGYVRQIAEWDGEEWSEPETESDEGLITNREPATQEAETDAEQEYIELPDYVDNEDSAAVYMDGYQIRSLPLRMVKEK